MLNSDVVHMDREMDAPFDFYSILTLFSGNNKVCFIYPYVDGNIVGAMVSFSLFWICIVGLFTYPKSRYSSQDECHFIKNYKASRTQAALPLLKVF